MAIKNIVLYTKNEKALRKESAPVKGVNRQVKKLIRDLKETLMARGEGIGLAAPQINVHQRVIVVRLGSRNENGEEPDPPIAIVNPKIIESGDEQRDFDGCLSFPGLFAETVRPHYLRVAGLDETGKPFDRIFEDFDAVLVHHEIDHLNGVLFIDRVESIEDLYRIQEDENGKLIRMPVSAMLE